MLYLLPRLSLRPWSSTVRRVWKTKSIQCISASRSYYATPIHSEPASTRAATASKATKPTKPTTKSSTTAAKPKKKPAAKKAAAKPKRKVVAKKKPAAKKKPVKKVPTEKQQIQLAKKKLTQQNRELKERALLNEPAKLETNPWLLYISEHRKREFKQVDMDGMRDIVKGLATKYKQLSTHELELLKQQCKANVDANAIAYKNWVSQYTPEQIVQANAARRAIVRNLEKKRGKEITVVPRQYLKIKDDRLPKRPLGAFPIFFTEKFGPGSANGTRGEAMVNAKKEFAALSSEEKKVYEEKAAIDRARYHAEQKTVFQ